MTGFLFLSLLIGSFQTPILSAAPAVTSNLCHIQGIITSINQRTHKYEPESWRKSWRLPKERIYIDIQLDIQNVSSEGKTSDQGCMTESLKDKVFQLKDNQDQKKIKKGQCIKAKTQFSGDEFSIGQWLWEIKLCNS